MKGWIFIYPDANELLVKRYHGEMADVLAS